MVWESFLGRFHPLLVHLPIGIFILGFLLELAYQFNFRKILESRKPIIFTYIVGLFFGILAAITGWLLSLNGFYIFEALEDHKIVGIITLFIMLAVIIIQLKIPDNKGNYKLLVSLMAVIFIGITGHLGGNLTHGQNYLSKYAPRPFNSDFNENKVALNNIQPDSVIIYRDIIDPIIKNKCFGCHNSENNRAGLILETYNDLFHDDNHDKPITPNDLKQSAIYERVSLPPHNELVMPPRGDNFGYTNLYILKYWIENGADSLAKFNYETMSKELIMLLQRDYNLDYSYKPYYEKVEVDSLSAKMVKTLLDSEYKFNYLAENNHLLDISFAGDTINASNIKVLNDVANHITFLSLEDSQLSDNLAKSLPAFPHLTRVNLGKNKLTNLGLEFLLQHSNLESINLNSTLINYDFLNKLVALPAIKRVYVYNTEITADELALLKKNYDEIDFVSQFQFQEVNEAKSVFEIESRSNE